MERKTGSQTSSSSAQPPAIDPGIQELIDHHEDVSSTPAQPERKAEGESKPRTQGEPPEAAPKEQPQPKPSVQEPGAPTAPVQEPPTEQPKFKVRGKEYTAEEISRDPELLRQLTTTHEQFPWYQQQYTELKKWRDGIEAQAQERLRQMREQQPAAPTFSPEQVEGILKPHVAELVKAGYVEEDVAAMFPKFTAQAVLYARMLDDSRVAIGNLIGRIGQLEQYIQGANGQQQAQSIFNTLDSISEALTKKDQVFQPLTDTKVREGFYEYLRTQGTPYADPAQLSEEFLARQWAAYNSDAWLEAARQQREAQQREQQRKQRFSAGEGGGARGGPPTQVEPAPWDDLIQAEQARR